MPAKIELVGWDAMIQQLTHEPEAIREEVRPLIHEHTEGTAEDLRRAYPEASHTAHGTGVLRSRVRTVYPSSSLNIGVVQSRAPHAYIYHWGSKKRKTRAGWNRGVMHQGKDRSGAFVEPLVPIARSRRRRLMRAIETILERRGYVITGGE